MKKSVIKANKIKKALKEVKTTKVSIDEKTIEKVMEFAPESLKITKKVMENVVFEGGDIENFTIEDKRDLGYEIIQNRDDIEGYRP